MVDIDHSVVVTLDLQNPNCNWVFSLLVNDAAPIAVDAARGGREMEDTKEWRVASVWLSSSEEG